MNTWQFAFDSTTLRWRESECKFNARNGAITTERRKHTWAMATMLKIGKFLDGTYE